MADNATPDVTAESSPAVAPESAPVSTGSAKPLDSLTSEQRHEWRLTGKLPDPTDSATAVDTPSTQPEEQAASTDAKEIEPASEPGVPPKKNADTRKAELKAQIQAEAKRLREIREAVAREEGRLEALKPATQTDEPRAKSSPAPADAGFTFPTFDQFLDKAPNASYEDYIDARADARYAFRETQQREAVERESRTKAFTEQVETFKGRLAEAEKADPEFKGSLSPEILSLRPSSYLHAHGEPITPQSELAERFLKSPVGPQLMRHFSTHQEDYARFTSSLPPDEFYVELGKLEGRLDGGQTAAPASAPNYTTKAPKPPTTLGTRPTDGGDPIVAALARRDFAAFKAHENKRELAARR